MISLKQWGKKKIRSDLYRDKFWLSRKYNNEEKSTYEIAGICNVHPTTICNWLRRFGIEIRPKNSKEKLTARFSVDLPIFLVNNIKKYCRKKNILTSEFFKRMIIDYLIEKENVNIFDLKRTPKKLPGEYLDD